jgi:photosystem II stability/assembly factor-like uncharacterized protein
MSIKLLPTLAVALWLAAPHWTIQTSGVTATFRGVSAVNDTVAWASGSGSTVLRTADGGATWQKLTVTTDRLDFRDVDAIDERTAYILSIGNGPASRLYKTTDAGATWAQQFKADDPKMFLDAMTFWDADHGVVMGDSIDGHFCILITENGGSAWSRVPDAALPPALPNEGAFAGSGTNIAVWGSSDAWIGTSGSRVLHTPDRGKTWSVAATPMPTNDSTGIFSLAFRDALHGVAVGGDYKQEAVAVDNLSITRDGGQSWLLVKGQSTASSSQYLSGFRSVVRYVPGTTALIAVGPQGADWSDDDGRSWIALGPPGFHTFDFSPSGRVGWGAGGRGSLARLDR